MQMKYHEPKKLLFTKREEEELRRELRRLEKILAPRPAAVEATLNGDDA